MKRTVFYIVAAVALFCGAFAPQSIIAQGSKQFDLYTQALKRLVIYRDSTKAYELVNQALVIDSTYTAANNLLSRLERDPQKASRLPSELLRPIAPTTTFLSRLPRYPCAPSSTTGVSSCLPALLRIAKSQTTSACLLYCTI